MNDLLQSLKNEFQDEEYRYAYAQSFLNTKLASQIKTLREQRQMTQAEVAAEMEIKQPGYRRFEDVNHDVWKTDSLWNIARALGVRLDISFKTFGTLPEDKINLSKESLQVPKFEDDPAFKEAMLEPDQEESFAKANTLQSLADPAGLRVGDQISDWATKLALAEAITKWLHGGSSGTPLGTRQVLERGTKRVDRKKSNVIEMPKRSEAVHLSRRKHVRREERREQRAVRARSAG